MPVPACSFKKPLALLLVAAGLLCTSYAAQVCAAEQSKRALLLAKSLSYERRLTATKGATVGIAVLYAGDRPSSLAAAELWLASFLSLALRVDGSPVEVVIVAYDPSRLRDMIRGRGIDVLLACDGVPFQAVSDLARDQAILSAADTRAGVIGGLSLGVFLDGEKPRILINMRATRAEGAKFSAKLLQLAEVI